MWAANQFEGLASLVLAVLFASGCAQGEHLAQEQESAKIEELISPGERPFISADHFFQEVKRTSEYGMKWSVMSEPVLPYGAGGDILVGLKSPKDISGVYIEHDDLVKLLGPEGMRRLIRDGLLKEPPRYRTSVSIFLLVLGIDAAPIILEELADPDMPEEDRQLLTAYLFVSFGMAVPDASAPDEWKKRRKEWERIYSAYQSSNRPIWFRTIVAKLDVMTLALDRPQDWVVFRSRFDSSIESVAAVAKRDVDRQQWARQLQAWIRDNADSVIVKEGGPLPAIISAKE